MGGRAGLKPGREGMEGREEKTMGGREEGRAGRQEREGTGENERPEIQGD